MSNIDNILEQILDAKYGRDVRQAIHDGIEECYAETGGTGLSDEAKTALLNCFAHVAWTDEHGQDYYDALESALYPTYTITNNLTDVTNSNTATGISGGSSYTATLTADSGYLGNVTVTMGGVDVTSSVFTPNTGG